MKYTKLYTLILSLLALTLLQCSEVVPVWTGEVQFKDYTLHYSLPRELKMEINTEELLELEFELTYDTGIARDNLPISIILEDEQSHEIIEETIDIPIKSEDQWIGVADENEVDYTLTHIAIPELQLKPGKYTLKLYSNDEKTEKIYGVVKIVARLFKLSQQEEG